METVQAVASNQEFPSEFIRPEDEQPGLTTFKGQPPQIPVIDFGLSENLVQSVFDASCEWGFFQIVNHGIPSEVLGNLQRVGKQFFELPQEEKEVYAKDPKGKSVEGYGTKLQKEVEGKKGWVDHLFNKIWPPSAIDYKFWPKNPPDYREATEEYAKHLHEVVNKLLRSLSLGLGLEAEELKKGVGGEELVYNLKINFYPPCPRPDLALGVPAHSDMSALTILVPNEVQGLQVFQHGNWYDVSYIPNALVIHIGDQIEILSNGKCKSVVHRTTVNKEKTRMSWPVFMEPPPHFEVGPHFKLVSDENPPKFETKKFSDFVYCKLNKIPQ
ncbi:hypothetical protein RD792_012173 [Penstemon davidsonii]|uniref:Fe2OG dioxygenase domain-containing protein n=1 Tax=Penstemon davidsonii TaxID=160366 RepID=A0ABR0CXI8_9LAMI|nr:hypothetical protein RD792_012173 [Penstemon davidsonii]